MEGIGEVVLCVREETVMEEKERFFVLFSVFSPRSLLPVMFVYRKRVQRDCQVAGKGEEGDKPFLLFLLLSRDLFLTFLLSDLVHVNFLFVKLVPGRFFVFAGLGPFWFLLFFCFFGLLDQSPFFSIFCVIKR